MNNATGMKIVAIGCGGFVGSHFLDHALVRPNVSIEGWDPDTHKIERHLSNSRLTLHKTTCQGPEQTRALEAAIERADVVINFAAICNPSEYNTHALRVINSNLFEIYPIIELCSKHRTWLVHFSTSEVYGRTIASYVKGASQDDPELYELQEDHTPLLMGPIANQRWTYACAKQMAERLVYAHHMEHGLPFTIVRPLNFFGPRMDYLPGRDGEGVPRVLACFMSALIDRKPMQLVDGGTSRRTIVSIDEAIQALELMLERSDKSKGEIFNIGNRANEVTIAELADLMRRIYAEITGDPSFDHHPIESVSAAEFYGTGYEDCDRRMPDLRKAERLLGWKPRKSLEEILRYTMQDYYDRYARSSSGGAASTPAPARALAAAPPDPHRSGPLPSDRDHSGRSFAAVELENLRAVLDSGTLTATHGKFNEAFEAAASSMLGVSRVITCNSGTAAVHAAIAAFDPEPGSEFIVTPLTDFGGVAPILWQGCVPVFADIDPETFQVTASTIERCLSERTAGIIVTHQFGGPAPVHEVRALAARHGIRVIEDCAQAYLAELNGQLVGTFGDVATFSLQQTKHISTGEGGFVATNDPAIAARVDMFINKGRNYSDPWPNHHFLAMNYRLTELQAAVALAQLERLDRFVAQRRESAALLVKALEGGGIVSKAKDVNGARHAYWRIPLVVKAPDPKAAVDRLAARLSQEGIAAEPHYKRPAYEWSFLRKRRTFGRSGYPLATARAEAVNFEPANFPGVESGLARLLVLPWNERLEAAHVDQIATALKEAVRML